MIDYKNAKGWLRPEEREALFEYAQDATDQSHDNIIVNIGVEYGASVYCLAAGSFPHTHIYCIDKDLSKFRQEDVGYPLDLLVLREIDSGEYAKQSISWAIKNISLLFIDGDHTYEGVKRDLAWLKYVRCGGYAIFHDCYDFDDPSKVHEICPGVNRAVEEWYNYQPIEHHHDNHGYAVAISHPEGYFFEQAPVGTMRIFRRIE